MTETMDEVALLAHLPGLRMEAPAQTFLGGRAELQRVSWDLYTQITGGAFDRKSEYLTDEPVFIMSRTTAPLVPPIAGSGQLFAEAKSRSDSYDILGHLPNPRTVAWGLDLAHTAWVCLSLAYPLSGFIQPRLSTMFLLAQGVHEFAYGDRTASGIQLQGEADHEYLFANALAGPMLRQDEVSFADGMMTLVGPIMGTPQLSGALETFLAAQDPALGRMEQGLLCVIALEELLLEGQKRDLRRSFATRLFALVPEEMRETHSVASFRDLYDLRSDFLHGRETGGADEAALLAKAPLLLAVAIRGLAQALMDGADYEDLRAEGLEKCSLTSGWQPLDQFRPENRMSGYRHSVVTSMTTRMAAPEDKVLVWAPYLGLEAPAEGIKIGAEDTGVFLPLRFDELSDLEDRNVRGDYMMRTQTAIQLGQLPDRGRSCLMLPLQGDHRTDLSGRPPRDYAAVRAFTIALRVLGFQRFIDPVLLGEFQYHGNLRLRIPTVYRQTLIWQVFSEFDAPDAADLGKADGLRDVVMRIAHDHPGLDRLLTLLREAHFADVLPDAVQARLAFAFIDGAIGRISGEDIAGQVARLANGVAPDASAQWFIDKARAMRNGLAHGDRSAVTPEDLSSLLRFASALGLTLLTYADEAGEEASIKGFQSALREEFI